MQLEVGRRLEAPAAAGDEANYPLSEWPNESSLRLAQIPRTP